MAKVIKKRPAKKRPVRAKKPAPDKHGWLSVKNELPINAKPVLANIVKPYVAKWLAAYDRTDKLWRSPSGRTCVVTHWQSFPGDPE